jgi:hypothetical protein
LTISAWLVFLAGVLRLASLDDQSITASESGSVTDWAIQSQAWA